jgi:hypothetical protein
VLWVVQASAVQSDPITHVVPAPVSSNMYIGFADDPIPAWIKYEKSVPSWYMPALFGVESGTGETTVYLLSRRVKSGGSGVVRDGLYFRSSLLASLAAEVDGSWLAYRAPRSAKVY